MSSRSEEAPTAEIVDMLGFLHKPGRKRIATTVEFRESATLLSIRQNLAYQATMGIDDPDNLSATLSSVELSRISSAVRQLLDAEFGHLRVHRYRQVFAVGHHCLESLIAGLLRVQFHARKIDASALQPDEGADNTGTSVSWGVGDTLTEAENERMRRRRLTHS